MAKLVMATATFKLKWWFVFYLYGLKLFSYMSGLEPDWEKFDKVCRKGINFKIIT